MYRRLLVVTLLVLAAWAGWQGYATWRERTAWERAVALPVPDFPPGTVRLVRGLWVARQPGGEFYVFLPRSDFYPDRTVQWIEVEGRFVEPISSATYGVDGMGTFGPSGRLYRVASRLEGTALLVLPDTVISGGPTGDPAWLVDLKDFFRQLRAQPPEGQAPARSP